MAKKGSLMVVGSGIKSVGHITLEAQGWIRQADIVLYCVADPATEIWIKQMNTNAEDLSRFYAPGTPRGTTYDEMKKRMLQCVREDKDVCAVFYGHPGVFVRPSHEAIMEAAKDGYAAGMIPGVSALDCLLADLNIDPAQSGCQMYDATDYLLYNRTLNRDCHVVLYQIDSVGVSSHNSAGYDSHNLPILVDKLQETYGPDHMIVHYQAAKYPICQALIQNLQISELAPAMLTSASTLYIPPQIRWDPDPEMARRLGLTGATSATQGSGDDAIPYRPAVAKSKLASLISDLSQNPRLLAAYRSNPQHILQQYGGLSEAENAAAGRAEPDADAIRMTML